MRSASPVSLCQQKIAIEIKTFLGTSTLFEFHLAVGQFVNYRFLLNKIEPDRNLYLAVPVETYETFFRRETVREMTQDYHLEMAVYHPDLEVIKQWIEWNNTETISNNS